MTVFDGKKKDNPTQTSIQSGTTEMQVALKEAGWTPGDNTMIYELGLKITFNQRKETLCHVTINNSSIRAVVILMLKGGVKQADTLKYLLENAYFHATVAAGDTIFDKDNPRWRSDKSQWDKNKYYDVDEPVLADVVNEAKAFMGRK